MPAELCTLREGDVVVMDAKVIHQGTANISNSIRALMQFSFLGAKAGSKQGATVLRPQGFTYHLDDSASGMTFGDFV